MLDNLCPRVLRNRSEKRQTYRYRLPLSTPYRDLTKSACAFKLLLFYTCTLRFFSCVLIDQTLRELYDERSETRFTTHTIHSNV